MSQSSESIALGYAAARPRWRRRVRRVLLGLMVLGMGLAAWRWGPYAWRQSRLLYWQRQCMNFSMPADAVVYEEEPVAAGRLLKGKDYSPYILKRSQNYYAPGPSVQAASFVPECLRNLGTFTKLPGSAIIPSGPRGGGAGPIIFLHERTSPSGHRRLVCVSYWPGTVKFEPEFYLWGNCAPVVATPATWARPLTVATPSVSGSIIEPAGPAWPPLVRVYAGQPDQNDAAHFTIRYQMWGHEDVLDGRLRDDDQVTLIARHSPD